MSPSLTSEQKQQQPVHKKMRKSFGSLNDQAASSLNQTGISKLLSGQEDEAEVFFSQALGMIDNNNENIRSRRPSPQSVSPLPGRASTTSATHQDTTPTCTASTPGNAEPASPTKHQEYDEGMHAYREPLILSDCTNHASMCNTILYNVGLTYIRQGKYLEAKQKFELALEKKLMAAAPADRRAVQQRLVQIYHNLGYCWYRLKNFDESLELYQRALDLCTHAHLAEIHLAHAINCIAVLKFHQGNDSASDSGDSLSFLNQSLKAYRFHYGTDSEAVATVMNNLGRIYYMRADYVKALAVYETALRIRRKRLDPCSIDLCATICNIGQTHQQLKQIDEALEYYNEFLYMPPIRKGDAFHRDRSIILMCKAEIHHERGDLMSAKDTYEKALVEGQKAAGLLNADCASTMNRLGNVHYQMRDLDMALQWYTHGLSIEKSVLRPDHPHLLVTLNNIAQIHRESGRLAEAVRVYREIHYIQIESKETPKLELAKTLSTMGLLEYTRRKYNSAFEFYQQALILQREVFGEENDNLEVASTLNAMGLALFSVRTNAAAAEYALKSFEECLRMRQRLLGENHVECAIVWYNIATAYLQRGEDELAIQYYEQTLKVEQASLSPNDASLVVTLQHLGLVYQQKGDLNRALNYFGQALGIERSLCTAAGRTRMSVGKLLNLIGNLHLQRGDVEEMMACYAEASRIFRQLDQPNDTLLIAGYNFYGMSKLHPPSAPVA